MAAPRTARWAAPTSSPGSARAPNMFRPAPIAPPGCSRSPVPATAPWSWGGATTPSPTLLNRWSAQWPDREDERNTGQKHDQRQRRAQPGIMAEAVAARGHHQRIPFLADGGGGIG